LMTGNHRDPSRRAFLIGACGAATLAAGGFGTALLADDAWAAKGIKRRKERQGRCERRQGSRAAKSEQSRVLLGNVKGTPVAVVREGDDYTAHQPALHALREPPSNPTSGAGSARCTARKFALDGDLERGARAERVEGILEVASQRTHRSSGRRQEAPTSSSGVSGGGGGI
jgi:hypothetical protein